MGRTSRRAWIVGATVLGLVVLLGAGALVLAFRPGEPVVSAADELTGWRGVKYRGTITDVSGVRTAVTLTVAADGRAFGTFERRSGARAQVLVGEPGTVLNANREWWSSVSGAEADPRSGVWVPAPPAEDSGLLPLERLAPPALAHVLEAPDGGAWRRTGERTVGGRPGEVWSDGRREVVIGADQRQVLSATLPVTDWWSLQPPRERDHQPDPTDEPSPVDDEAPGQAAAELTVAESDDEEMDTLEEMAGKAQELLEEAKNKIEEAEKEEAEERRRREAGNC